VESLEDEDHEADLEEMEKMFGSVPQTLYSLYKAMSGGADWGDVAQPLEDRIHFLFSPFFCMYIAFAVFAVLNVVTGVFVNEAMVMAGKDQELVIEEELSRKGSDINEFIRMFHEADADGNGKVSWDEFREQMEDDRVKAYFKVLDLNVDEAEQLFVLLDPQVSGEVSIDDFVQGCIRMKGGAKSIDVQTLLWQNKAMMEDLKKMNSRLEIIGA
jgi:RNA binding exosome subunit